MFRYLLLIAAMGCCVTACAPGTGHDEAATPGAVAVSDASLSELVEGTGVTAIVQHLGEDRFEITFVFDRPQAAMIFSRSGTDYRTASWTPLDPGVVLERLNGFDTLVLDPPSDTARFEIVAQPDIEYQGYSHFTRFTDGGQTLFTGQFELLPVESREAASALNGSMSNWSGEQPRLGVRVRSDQPMITAGEPVAGEAVDVSLGDGAFVYIGEGAIETTDNYVGVLDDALPDWIRSRFSEDLGFVFGELEAGWGFGLPDRATLYFAFGGHENPGFSNKGGVTRNQLMINSSGAALRERDDFIHTYLLWFFAHEAVHLFQNVSETRLSDGRDSWIHEGGANAMANRILYERGEDSAAYLAESFGRAQDGCIASLEAGPLREAGQRGQFRSYYDCGEFIALMSDGALEGVNYFAIWNAMQARAVQQEEGAYDGALYFATLRDLGIDETALARLESLVHDRVEDPRATLNLMLRDFGLAPQFDADGRLTAISYPDD